MPTGLLRRGTRRVAAWSPEERDAVLYAGSALFAGLTILVSSIPLYRQWGQLAVGPYALGALLSAIAARHSEHRTKRSQALELDARGESSVHPALAERAAWHWTPSRLGIFLLVLCGATLMPLSLEVLWQAEYGGSTHVQPEVVVVEQGAGRVLHGRNLYLDVHGRGAAAARVSPNEPAYDAYFPYLPGMAVFGLPSGTTAPPRLTDARVVFSVITMILVVVSLALCRGPSDRRSLTLQAMTVLPMAALPLATGGDDLPVVAFMLLGMVLALRRRPVLAGLALGAASSLKFTAWPLALLALFVARNAHGKRAIGRMIAGMAVVVVPAVLPVAVRNPLAFIDNVVRFPLGLTGVTSPAASALPGHLLVMAFPGIHRAFTLVVAAVGLLVILHVLVRHPPRVPSNAVLIMAWASVIAIMLAPATRVGYLLYPADLFVWVWLLRGEEAYQVAESAGSGQGGNSAVPIPLVSRATPTDGRF